MKKSEIDYLKAPEKEGYIPLAQRLSRYLNEKVADSWSDPKEIEDEPKFMKKPFKFYGDYVSLSQTDKTDFAERELVNYYKCIIKDQSKAIEQLKEEIVVVTN